MTVINPMINSGGKVKSVNGQTGDVVLKALDINAIPQFSDTPTISEYVGKVFQYVGPNGLFTNGYFYRGLDTSTYGATLSFQPGTESGVVVSCSGSDFITLIKAHNETAADITTIVGGAMGFDSSNSSWIISCMDINDEPVVFFQLSQTDFETAGFTFTGIPQTDDMVLFTATITKTSTSYDWEQVDVQPAVDPLPSQTGNSGKVLTTDGTNASWVDMTTSPQVTPVLQGTATYWITDPNTGVISQTINVQGVTATNVVMVSPTPVSADDYAQSGVICTAQGTGTLTFTCKTIPSVDITLTVICF